MEPQPRRPVDTAGTIPSAAHDDAELLHESHASDATRAHVSVCVSLYQYEQHIEACLDSVAAQTLSPLSLIVVDDASRDEGPQRVRAWMADHAERFAHQRLLRHPTNLGLAATRNHAIARSESEFVFILDADNELYPRCLESLKRALDCGSADFAYSIIEQFGDVRGLGGCDAWSPAKLATGNYIDAMALLCRATWVAVGGYRAMRTPGWEDFDFWCRCVEAELTGVLVPEILCRYRVHPHSMLRRSTDTLRNHVLVCDEIREAHPWVKF